MDHSFSVGKDGKSLAWARAIAFSASLIWIALAFVSLCPHEKKREKPNAIQLTSR